MDKCISYELKVISFKQFYKKYSLTFLEERLEIFHRIYERDRSIEIKTIFSLN